MHTGFYTDSLHIFFLSQLRGCSQTMEPKRGRERQFFLLHGITRWFIVHHGQTIVSPPLWGPCSSIFVQIEIDFLRLSQYLTLLWSNSSFCLIVISMSGKQLKFLCDGKFLSILLSTYLFFKYILRLRTKMYPISVVWMVAHNTTKHFWSLFFSFIWPFLRPLTIEWRQPSMCLVGDRDLFSNICRGM